MKTVLKKLMFVIAICICCVSMCPKAASAATYTKTNYKSLADVKKAYKYSSNKYKFEKRFCGTTKSYENKIKSLKKDYKNKKLRKIKWNY